MIVVHTPLAQRNRYDGMGKDLTKDCEGCPYRLVATTAQGAIAHVRGQADIRQAELGDGPDKTLQVCAWGVALKILSPPRGPRGWRHCEYRRKPSPRAMRWPNG